MKGIIAALVVPLVLASGVLVATHDSKPQTAAEWITENMIEVRTDPDPATGQTLSGLEVYWDLRLFQFQPGFDMTPQDYLLDLGLTYDSQPTLQEVEDELDRRWEERQRQQPPDDNRLACEAAGGYWVGGYDSLVEAAGGNCACRTACPAVGGAFARVRLRVTQGHRQ